MSSVKSTHRFNVEGQFRSQSQTLLKQGGTRLFDSNYFSVYIKAWNASGGQSFVISPPPASQVGNHYTYPSGTLLTIYPTDSIGSPFLFWHGFNQNLRTLYITVTGSLSLDAIYSGSLISGNTCSEDFTNFPSGNDVLDLGAYSVGWAPKPRLFRTYGAGQEEDFSTWASGDILQTGALLNENLLLSRTVGTSMAFNTLSLFWAEGKDEYTQFPTGDITNLDIYDSSITGNGYFKTGILYSTFSPNYTQFFDFSSGYRDNFPNFLYNFTTTYQTVGASLPPLTGFVKPQYFVWFEPFDYTSGERDIFTESIINYQGGVMQNLASRVKPLYVIGFESFSNYPSGTITTLGGWQCNYISALATFSGKIYPSGG